MKKYIAIAAFSGASSVALGAFGAHGLKDVLTAVQLNSFLTGIRYQAIHSLLLLIVMIIPFLSDKQKKNIGNTLIAGILMFSGSIYLLSLSIVPSKYLWFVTPVGGLLLLAAWLLLGMYSLKTKKASF